MSPPTRWLAVPSGWPAELYLGKLWHGSMIHDIIEGADWVRGT
jgi:hypothetical protein